MPVLVDGNNLLYAARDVPALRRVDRLGLCRLLGQWGARVGTGVTVMFDGPSPPLAVVQQMRASGVEVAFSGGRSADDVILEALEREPAAGQFTVVSSDHSIQHSARYHRAVATDSEEFIRDLLRPGLEDPRASDPQAPPEKPEGPVPGETEEWLRRLGLDPDRPSDVTEWLE